MEATLQKLVSTKNQQGGARYFHAQLPATGFSVSALTQAFSDAVSKSGVQTDEIYVPTSDHEWRNLDSEPQYQGSWAKEVQTLLSGHSVSIYSSGSYGMKTFVEKERKDNEAAAIDGKFVVIETKYDCWEAY
jgi:hypothetical protein